MFPPTAPSHTPMIWHQYESEAMEKEEGDLKATATTNSHLYVSNGHHLTLTRPTTPNDASNHDGNSDGSISSPKYVVFFFLSYLFIHYYHRIAQ